MKKLEVLVRALPADIGAERVYEVPVCMKQTNKPGPGTMFESSATNPSAE